MSINGGLALFGLLMALIEIHSPHLSTRVEAALDYLHDRFVCYSDKVQQQQDRIKKLYLQSKYRKRFLQIISLSFLAFLLSGLAFGIYDDPSRLTLLETVIMSLPGIVFLSVSTMFLLVFLACHAIYWPIAIVGNMFSLLAIIMAFLNRVGNGKALSGIGIALAVHGVLTT
jgi:ABC-type multidrug transport system fused ATPase/permease subunit